MHNGADPGESVGSMLPCTARPRPCRSYHPSVEQSIRRDRKPEVALALERSLPAV